METAMRLAIETYSKLTDQPFETIVKRVLGGDEVLTESIMLLMFVSAK